VACSSSGSGRALVAVLMATTVLPGCWTGHLMESARRRESSLRYERAFLDGDRLYLEYDVAVRNRRGEELRRGERRAAVALSDLAARPELPIDELPVAFDARRPPEPADPVPLVRGDARRPPEPADPVPLVRGDVAPPSAATRRLRVVRADDRDAGLVLEVPGGVQPAGRLHSGSLTRDRTAPWAWPLLPLAVALDVAVLPLHVLGIGFFYVTPE